MHNLAYKTKEKEGSRKNARIKQTLAAVNHSAAASISSSGSGLQILFRPGEAIKITRTKHLMKYSGDASLPDGICPGNKRQLCHQQQQQRQMRSACLVLLLLLPSRKPAGWPVSATRIHFSSVQFFAPFLRFISFVSLLSIPISICNTLKWHCPPVHRCPPCRRHLHTVWPQNCSCFFYACLPACLAAP